MNSKTEKHESSKSEERGNSKTREWGKVHFCHDHSGVLDEIIVRINRKIHYMLLITPMKNILRVENASWRYRTLEDYIGNRKTTGGLYYI